MTQRRHCYRVQLNTRGDDTHQVTNGPALGTSFVVPRRYEKAPMFKYDQGLHTAAVILYAETRRARREKKNSTDGGGSVTTPFAAASHTLEHTRPELHGKTQHTTVSARNTYLTTRKTQHTPKIMDTSSRTPP